MYIHSSHGYTLSKWANNDPGNVQTVSDLIQMSSSMGTSLIQGRTIMKKCRVYTTGTRCSTHLDNIWMAGNTIHYIVSDEGFARNLPNRHVIGNIVAPFL
jgi:hypothetical protein